MTRRTDVLPSPDRAAGRLTLSRPTGSAARLLGALGWVGPAAALAAAGLHLAVPGWDDRGSAGSPALVVAALLIGGPHGLLDLALPGNGGPYARVWPGYLGYAAVTILAYLGFLLAPGAGTAAFVVMSILHLGSADVAHAARRRGGAPPRDLAGTVAHGAAIVVLPLLAWPEPTRRLLAAILPGVAPPGRAALVAAGLCWGAIALHVVARDLRRRRYADVVDLTCLATLLLAVPPLTATAVYFALWHALRHTVRAAPVLRRRPDRRARPVRLGLLLLTGGTATAAIVAACLLLTALVSPGRPVEQLVVALVAAVTVPHTLAIARFDLALRAGAAEPDPASTRGGADPVPAGRQMSPDPTAATAGPGRRPRPIRGASAEGVPAEVPPPGTPGRATDCG